MGLAHGRALSNATAHYVRANVRGEQWCWRVRFSPISPDLLQLVRGGEDHGRTTKLMLPLPGQEQAGTAMPALPQHWHPCRELPCLKVNRERIFPFFFFFLFSFC